MAGIHIDKKTKQLLKKINSAKGGNDLTQGGIVPPPISTNQVKIKKQ